MKINKVIQQATHTQNKSQHHISLMLDDGSIISLKGPFSSYIFGKRPTFVTACKILTMSRLLHIKSFEANHHQVRGVTFITRFLGIFRSKTTLWWLDSDRVTLSINDDEIDINNLDKYFFKR